uniref:Uncharacterized protein n=1 Tax=Rhizophora mucronata TaxID=61149 RepID=A0A2P2NVU4_RHIMU
MEIEIRRQWKFVAENIINTGLCFFG